MLTVYLAGGISGLTYEQATTWRNQVNEALSSYYHILDPMRGKEHLAGTTIQDSGEFDNDPQCNPLTVFRRDTQDVAKSDVVLANMDTVKGIGTPFEIGMAYAWGRSIVIVINPNHPRRMHPFVAGFCSAYLGCLIVDSVSDAIRVLQAFKGEGCYPKLSSS